MTTRENSTPLRYGASPLRDTLRRSAFSRRLGEKVLWGRIVPESRVASIFACEPLAVSVQSRLRYVQEIQAPSTICLSLSAEGTDVLDKTVPFGQYNNEIYIPLCFQWN